MGFKIEDEVVCISNTWEDLVGFKCNSTPIKGDVYCVDYVETYDGEQYIGLTNLDSNDCFESKSFRKVEPKKETETATSKILREFKESEIIKEVDTIDKPNPVHA